MDWMNVCDWERLNRFVREDEFCHLWKWLRLLCWHLLWEGIQTHMDYGNRSTIYFSHKWSILLKANRIIDDDLLISIKCAVQRPGDGLWSLYEKLKELLCLSIYQFMNNHNRRECRQNKIMSSGKKCCLLRPLSSSAVHPQHSLKEF